MGLQRWEPTTRYIGTGEYMGDMDRADDGDFYFAEDVDALLASIRAAVEAEWVAVDELEMQGLTSDLADYVRARAALDALLADGDA